MKIALISGSRSDRNALVMVEKALSAAGHDARLVDYVSKNLYPATMFPVTMAAKAMELTSFLAIGEEDHRFADMAFVHGDRHEALAIAFACNVMGIPVVHIGGGDITEGSQDDCFRHAITKLSHLHFASNQDSADRIVQMGEEPDRVHVTGCPGIDMMVATPVLDFFNTCVAVNLPATEKPRRMLLVLFHPNTLGDTRSELEALSVALARRTEALVLLGPNADAGGDLIRREWQRLAQNRPDTVYHDNVEPQLFYSLLKWCDVLVGNSSAGYYEAPCFGIPVIDIWPRQKGRLAPDNVMVLTDFPHEHGIGSLLGEIDHILVGPSLLGAKPRARFNNFYGDGHAAARIAKFIGEVKDPRALLRKKFRTCQKLSGGYCSLDEKLEPLTSSKPRTAFTTAMETLGDLKSRYGYSGEGLI